MTGPAIVFDLDDTLYLERDFVRSGFRAAGDWLQRERGVDGLAEAAWRAFERGVRGHTFDRALATLGLPADPELVASLVDVYRNHTPSIRLAPDAAACLDALGDAPLALISDGPWRTQAGKLRALGLARRFAPAVLTGRLGPGFAKPQPRAFELVAAGSSAAERVYVADNPAKDFVAPRTLGWRTVRIRRPSGLYAALEPAPGAAADEEIADLRDLARVRAGRARPRARKMEV